MNKNVKRLIWAIVVIAFLIWGSTQFVVVNTERQAAVLESEKFDRVAFVDGIWESRLIPAVKNDSAELATVLTAIDQGLEKSQEFANISISGAYNFRVHGVGIVESVDLSSKSGKAVIRPVGYDGKIVVTLAVGPNVSGEAIRDGAGFISFGDFKDQTEYGQVSRELNKRSGESVFEALDWENMIGKKVSFGGMFTILTTNQTRINLDTILISTVYAEAAE